jgi:hypothetical protein
LRLALFLSYVLYCFYVGVLLVFLPWSPLWDANGLVARYPGFGAVILAGPTRGAVSALGILLLLMGIGDAVRFVRLGGSEDARR